MMKKALVASSFVAALACHPAANAEDVFLGAKVGTLGLGLEVTKSFSERLNGRATAQTSYEIGGISYSSDDVGTLGANIGFDNVAPYLGIGWTSTPGEESPWSYAFDLGVLFQGSPTARLTSTGGTYSNDPTFQSHLRAEEAELQDGIDDFKYFPVVSVGLNYRF
jgi:hypothetical protein